MNVPSIGGAGAGESGTFRGKAAPFSVQTKMSKKQGQLLL
jgi:hypothetical protein